MNTLAKEPLASLLQRLFAEAKVLSPTSVPALADYWNALPAGEQARLMHTRTDYREFYERMKDIPLPVSPETGRLLYVLARHSNARSIVEFGTSFGLSTLHLAAALRDNGGGRVITTEFEATKVARARRHFEEARLDDLIEIREGDALETLARDLPEHVDLLLLDGAKGLYPDVLDRIEGRLRPGALVVADNADFCPDYLLRVRALDSGYLCLPFGEDVELSVRTG